MTAQPIDQPAIPAGFTADHHGQHRNCRACGTNPRARRWQANPATLRAPDPLPAERGGRRRPPAPGVVPPLTPVRDCGGCGGSGWTDFDPDTGAQLAGVVACPCRAVAS